MNLISRSFCFIVIFKISICTADGKPPVCEKIEKCSQIPHNTIVGECSLDLNANKKTVKLAKGSLCDNNISKSDKNGSSNAAKWILDNIIVKIVCAPTAIFESLKINLEKCQVSASCDVYQIVVDYIRETIACGDVAFNSCQSLDDTLYQLTVCFKAREERIIEDIEKVTGQCAEEIFTTIKSGLDEPRNSYKTDEFKVNMAAVIAFNSKKCPK